MHSGFGINGIQQQQQQQQQHEQQSVQNTCHAPVLLSRNQTHILDQIHALPTTQQLFLDQHSHFLPPQSRLSHHYAGASPAYFPVNFKLGLARNNNDYRDCTTTTTTHDVISSTTINEGGRDASNLLRGSERYDLPQARHSSLGMLHCWQNQEDSPNKQQHPFWEPLPAEVSNENSEIVDLRQEHHLEMNNQQKETMTNCLDTKSRVHFGELEAIYKRLGTAETNQTGPSEIRPVNVVGLDHGSEPSIGEEPSRNISARKKRRKKKKETMMIDPMAEFFGNLVKQVMDHQENLHKKFAEVIGRLDEEKRARDEAWRNQELAHFEQEAAARTQEKAQARSREAMIVSYLEKITGQRINFPTNICADDNIPREMTPTNSSNDFRRKDEDDGGRDQGLELKPPGC